jgi:hypothetical protein
MERFRQPVDDVPGFMHLAALDRRIAAEGPADRLGQRLGAGEACRHRGRGPSDCRATPGRYDGEAYTNLRRHISRISTGLIVKQKKVYCLNKKGSVDMIINKVPNGTAFIHIGTDKTGTTLIQNFCLINRLPLLQAGLNYPRPIKKYGISHVDFSKEHGFYWNDDASIETSQNAGDKLFDQLNPEEDSALISSECFCYYNSKQSIINLKNWLKAHGYHQVRIIVYLRNQVDWLISLYSEYLRWGNRETIERFCEMYQLRFWHSNLLDDWESVFGHEAMIVEGYDDSKINLLDSFVSLLGFDNTAKNLVTKYRSTTSNGSLPQILLEYLRTLEIDLSSGSFYNFLSSRLVGVPRFLPELFSRQIWSLPENFLKKLNEFQKDNEYICDKYKINIPSLAVRAQRYSAKVQPMTFESVKDSAHLMLIELISVSSVWRASHDDTFKR